MSSERSRVLRPIVAVGGAAGESTPSRTLDKVKSLHTAMDPGGKQAKYGSVHSGKEKSGGKTGDGNEMSYALVILFMVNRSINLILYKALTTFSYYFATDFGIPYSVFAWVAIMNFPATLLNVAIVPFYSAQRVDYVLVFFELCLCGSCLLVLGWHNLAGLVFLRFATGFAITAVRSEVNAVIGTYTTKGPHRTRAISLLELSFGTSAAGFLAVGAALQYLGWQWFFTISAVTIFMLAAAIFVLVPGWKMENKHRSTKRVSTPKHGSTADPTGAHRRGDAVITVASADCCETIPLLDSPSVQKLALGDIDVGTAQQAVHETKLERQRTQLAEGKSKLKREQSYVTKPLSRKKMFAEIFQNKPLMLVFLAQVVNKCTRNAFYYTFSIWLATTYDLSPIMAGAVSLMMAAGHLIGTTSNTFMVPVFGVFGTCLLGAMFQFCSQFLLLLSWVLNFEIPLGLACAMIFCYFYGCQVWYNNTLDISMEINKNPILQPTIQTIFLAAGAGGGMCGTLASTHLWRWRREHGIGLLGSVCGVVLIGLVVSVWRMAGHEFEVAKEKKQKKRAVLQRLKTEQMLAVGGGFQADGLEGGKHRETEQLLAVEERKSELGISSSSSSSAKRAYLAGTISLEAAVGTEHIADMSGMPLPLRSLAPVRYVAEESPEVYPTDVKVEL
jgi:MFS family permease